MLWVYAPQTSPMSQRNHRLDDYFLVWTMGHSFLQFILISINSVRNRKSQELLTPKCGTAELVLLPFSGAAGNIWYLSPFLW